MNVTKILVRIDARIKLIEFESIAPVVEMSADIDDDDDPSACIEQLHKMVEKEWAKQAMQMIRFTRSRSKHKEDFDASSAETVASLKKLIANV